MQNIQNIKSFHEGLNNRIEMREARVSMIINYMCQFDWATVPRYLVKHYFWCFHEIVFEWNLHSKSHWSLSKTDFPSKYGWASSNQLKVWKEQKTCLPQTEGIQPAGCLQASSETLAVPGIQPDCLWIQAATLSEVSSLPITTIRFWTCQASKITWANCLK